MFHLTGYLAHPLLLLNLLLLLPVRLLQGTTPGPVLWVPGLAPVLLLAGPGAAAALHRGPGGGRARLGPVLRASKSGGRMAGQSRYLGPHCVVRDKRPSPKLFTGNKMDLQT